MIHIGFTGTRWGMSVWQKDTMRRMLDEVLAKHGTSTAHHGCCVGADAQFHELCRERHAWIVGHPGPDTEFSAQLDCDEREPPTSHFARNRRIVSRSDLMFATPAEMTPQKRGGTWYTIGYAQKVERAIAIVLPDGSYEFHGDKSNWTRPSR